MQVWFQSSFELTGYITITNEGISVEIPKVSKLFRAYGLYNDIDDIDFNMEMTRFKALSSLRVI